MNIINNIAGKAIAVATFLATSLCVHAAEVTYRIVEFNKTTDDFTIAASGMVPKDSWVYFENKFGATTGNRYNQIPRNNEAALHLEGWQGCRIKSITLSMCSNIICIRMILPVIPGLVNGCQRTSVCMSI